MQRKNCWEWRGCGREPGGIRADELGTCPASTETRLDGVHGGQNGGRACWAVAGSLGRGNSQSSCEWDTDCFHCEFYRSVLAEETPHIVYTPTILSILSADELAVAYLTEPDDEAE